jgi:hypothetical protein
MSTLDIALDTANKLSPSELDELIDILNKRRSQVWRKDTSDYYHSLKKDISSGKLTPIDEKKVIQELHDELDIDK